MPLRLLRTTSPDPTASRVHRGSRHRVRSLAFPAVTAAVALMFTAGTSSASASNRTVDLPAPVGDTEPSGGVSDAVATAYQAFQVAQANYMSAQAAYVAALNASDTARRQAFLALRSDASLVTPSTEAMLKAKEAVRVTYQGGDVSDLQAFSAFLSGGTEAIATWSRTAHYAQRVMESNVQDAVTLQGRQADAAAQSADQLDAYMTARTALMDAVTTRNEAKAAMVAAQLAYQQTLALNTPPQTQIGPDGCPTAVPDNTLRGGSDKYPVADLCASAVAQAATPQAAAAIKWAFAQLGAPYACDGVGRTEAYRFDCSSLVARAYYNSSGIPVAGHTWAPTSRNIIPWGGGTPDPHFVQVDPADLHAGDVVTYDTCPAGEMCAYRHVVMYIGTFNGQAWMLHTNRCGDVAKVNKFWGTGPDSTVPFLVAKRVQVLPTDPPLRIAGLS